MKKHITRFLLCSLGLLVHLAPLANQTTHAAAPSGTVVTWGRMTLPYVDPGTRYTKIAAGGYHTVALKNDGTVVAWGWNGFGQTTVPAGLGGVTAIAAGVYHTVALVGIVLPVVPSITRHPTNQIAKVGTNILLSAVAQGSSPLSYQWRRNGNPVTGATSASLPLNNVQLTDAGDYWVVVTNSYGAVTSAVARVNAYLPPATTQPAPPAATPATQPPATNLTARPIVPSSTQLKVFTGGGTIDRNKMTIVMTHGWKSSSTEWPTDMKNALVAKGYDAKANIVAWDWQPNALTKSPSTAAARTCSEGEALGSALLSTLGTGYNQPIHFIGHSLGTLVNCHAADYIHGDEKNSPGWIAGSTLKFSPLNTHVTMFDEAELVSALNGIHVFADLLLKPTGDTTANLVNCTWAKVIPEQSAWIDNYLSEVGLLHTEAANVLLWREPTLNPIYPHGSGYRWYSGTVGNPLGSLMGHRWSFERDSLGSAPQRGKYFLQSLDLNQSELTVTDVSAAVAAGLAGGYGVGLNRTVLPSAFKP